MGAPRVSHAGPKFPQELLDSLQPALLGAQMVTEGNAPFDWALLFVRSQAEMDQFALGVTRRVRPQAVVRFALRRKPVAEILARSQPTPLNSGVKYT